MEIRKLLDALRAIRAIRAIIVPSIWRRHCDSKLRHDDLAPDRQDGTQAMVFAPRDVDRASLPHLKTNWVF